MESKAIFFDVQEMVTTMRAHLFTREKVVVQSDTKLLGFKLDTIELSNLVKRGAPTVVTISCMQEM